MKKNYLFAVALVAVLAVAFSLSGTVVPVPQSTSPQQSSYSEDSVTHSMNPATFDSGWMDITDKCGQYFNVDHNLNTIEVLVDITGIANLTSEDWHQFWSMGDVNRDGYINNIDADLLVAAMGSTPEDPNWNPDADLNEDGIVSLDDFYIWQSNSGLDIWTYFHAEIHQRYLGLTGYTPGWSRTYGGANGDFAHSMVQTFDGGYALAGGTSSFGAGGQDFMLVKTDGSGNLQWNQTYGGTSDDSARCVVQTSDGGYALAGHTDSFGAGGWDFMLVKTDSSGNLQWNQTYGGTSDDMASSLVQTSDGGYALVGSTASYDAGYPDFWLVKTDVAGNALWNKTYRESLWDFAVSVVQTSDGGYALAGYTGPPLEPPDLWLVKTDSEGKAKWNATYGGASAEIGGIVIQTIDGGYALMGSTGSYGVGGYDVWLVKTDSVGNAEWNATYGGASDDFGVSVIQTIDGGYALEGVTESFGAGYRDYWLVKIDSAGTMLWDRVYGGAGWDEALTMVQTSDGGYALAGHTDSFGAGNGDFWLIKTDVEAGLAWTGLTTYTITLYRGKTDPYWNYVRVRIWSIKEPTWQYGDITGPDGVPDGVVDGYDLTLACGNYGKTYDDG